MCESGYLFIFLNTLPLAHLRTPQQVMWDHPGFPGGTLEQSAVPIEMMMIGLAERIMDL